MDKYIEDLTYVIRNCEMENTYKMCWIRSIVESCLLNPKQNEFHFDQLSSLIFGYYWNQTIFFDLEQSPNPNKRPKIHQIVKYKVVQYRSNYGYQPMFFSRVEDVVSFKPSQISTVLKQDVSWRFQKLGNEDFIFYDLDLDKRKISIHRPDLLIQYSDILFELINYKWTQKLEDFNTSPRISQKIKGTDRERIRRKSLSKFRSLLDLENPNRMCFITGLPISDKDLSIDHVIPWSYLFSDDLWNLVYVNKSENSSKSNRIPDEKMIERLEDRNKRLLNESIQKGVRTKHIEELKLCIEKDLVKKSWVGFKG